MDSVNTTIPKPSTTAFLLGVATVIAQSTLLREAMAAMGGSEMAWGLVMAMWLAGMGIGSRIGVRAGAPMLARILPVLALGCAGLGSVVFRAAPAILQTTSGETLTTWHATGLWALAIVPSAAAGGLAFPILAGEFLEKGPGRAYTLEAMGALVGGLVFSAILAPLGSVSALLIAIGFVGGLELWRVHPLLTVGLAIACLAAHLPAEHALSDAGWRWSGRPDELASRAETRLQRVEISAGEPTALYTNGRLTATYPNAYTTLPQAHLMMLLHPEPKRVLTFGCAADGSVEAFIHHGADEIFVVEEDPALIPLLLRLYADSYREALGHPAVQILKTDPLRALAGRRNLDLIILADGEPTTLRANRTRTTEFFRRCRAAMGESGLLVLRTGVSDTYLGGGAGSLVRTMATTLRDVFPVVAAVPGERILIVAGGPAARLPIELGDLERRLFTRREVAASLPVEMLTILVDPDRQRGLADFIDRASSPPNTIDHPRAVAIAAGLHEARSRPTTARTLYDLQRRGPKLLVWILASAIAGLLAIAALPINLPRTVAAAWVIGATSMGWWLLLLAIWQATRGSVYAEIGALTGLFMAGIAVGGWLGMRSQRPTPALLLTIGGGSAISLLIAAGIPTAAPTLLVPAFLLVGGVLAGAAFPSLGKLADEDSARRGAGLAFAADELGAAAAALTIGTIAIPWVGMTATAVGLALLGLAAIPAVLRE